MTAVVLAAGRGRRLQRSDISTLAHDAQRRAAASGIKVMMPVDAAGRRPFLDYVLDALAKAGCREVVLVVAPDHEAIRAHLDTRPSTGVTVRLAVQPSPEGTADAVACAAPLVTPAHFLVVNGDNLYPVTALRALADLDGCGLAAFSRETLATTSGFSVERLAAFALVRHDGAGNLTGLVEKPDPADLVHGGGDALVSMNLWKVSPAVVAACREVSPSARGERELPDAVQLALARGTPFRVVEAAGPVLDVTTATDVGIVSRALAGEEPRV
jgi:glucose-1-phosphate thymidylyltransferase